ncbi:hypothetical protein FDI21_gp320 [Pseudomonas phage Noxifer]|uniref:Uncharacterized protein n=1 Tax=Pseudomonas phage Noxifer TaxID=2006684 RepID=A0A1Y0SV50_9CAUD|nr:hypothetical protein FDI21_gp320 [Pseudomonas phage Noxifer]ARV77391.1 hypothetical protein NOXIFER_226 [Pseudomonas phage Noxifer]
MGIVVTLRDIIALGLIGLLLLFIVYLYAQHKYTNWRLKRHERKEARRVQQAMVDIAKE